MSSNTHVFPEGMVVFRSTFQSGGIRILLEAEQPATLNLIQRVLPKLMSSPQFGCAALMALGHAVDVTRELIRDKGFPFFETEPAVLNDRFDVALVGIEPTQSWTRWCMDFAELHANRFLVDLDGLHVNDSEVLSNRDPRWCGIVSDRLTGALWESRGLIKRNNMLVSGATVAVPDTNTRSGIRKRLGLQTSTRVLFCSGLVSADYPHYPDIQLSTLRSVLNGIKYAQEQNPLSKFACILRPHPRAKSENDGIQALLQIYPGVKVLWNPNISFDDCIIASDLVACMPTSGFTTQVPYYGRVALLLALRRNATGAIFDNLFSAKDVAHLYRMSYIALARYVADISSALRNARPKQRRRAQDGALVVAQNILGS